jgi:hypothetical protein
MNFHYIKVLTRNFLTFREFFKIRGFIKNGVVLFLFYDCENIKFTIKFWVFVLLKLIID